LTALADDEDATVRSAAAGALHQFASLPERALEPLASHDRQEAERVRQEVETVTRTVIQALLDGKRKTAEWLDRHYDDYAPGDIGPLGKEYSRLMERHREESDAVVSRLRRVLRDPAVGHEAVVDILRATLEKGDSDDRWAVSRVAEELGISELASRDEDEPVEVEGLIEVLQSHQSVGVRSTAAEALGETGDTRAVEPLIEVIKSGEEHPGLLMRFATALGHLGDPAAIEVLQPLTESGFDLVQKAANDALQELAGGRRRPTRPDHLEGAERERALAQKADYRCVRVRRRLAEGCDGSLGGLGGPD
jgi:HEAT repeat protein